MFLELLFPLYMFLELLFHFADPQLSQSIKLVEHGELLVSFWLFLVITTKTKINSKKLIKINKNGVTYKP
jgi:hypothetical protein